MDLSCPAWCIPSPNAWKGAKKLQSVNLWLGEWNGDRKIKCGLCYIEGGAQSPIWTSVVGVFRDSPVAQLVKNLPAMQETWV